MSLNNKQEIQLEAKKKKKSLRGQLGLPISGVLFSSPQFTGYDGGTESEGLSESNGSSINEMIHVAKDLQETIKKSGKNYEVYDIEEAGIPLYTAQFEPDMTDKQVGQFPQNEGKKFTAHVKNPESGKIVQIEYANPMLEIKEPKEQKPIKGVKPKNGTKHPRHWSAKYWSAVPVKKILSEIISPDEVDVTTLKFNDELNPLLFDENNKLKENVRNQLLKIAIEFIKSCKIEQYKYSNIVLVGSMANYTYTPQSDIDIHIVADFNQFKAEEELLGEYFDAKKDLWSTNHDIKINGHPVECYVQNADEPYTSLGVYSLIKDEWVREPLKKMVSVDEGNIQLKAAAYMNAIDKLEERFKNGEDVTSELKKLKDKIKNMRKNGLYKEGEYSTENLVFKILRNNGYLQKLINLKNNNIDQNLSL